MLTSNGGFSFEAARCGSGSPVESILRDLWTSWAISTGKTARTDCVANDVSLSSICRQRECLHTRPVGD